VAHRQGLVGPKRWVNSEKIGHFGHIDVKGNQVNIPELIILERKKLRNRVFIEEIEWGVQKSYLFSQTIISS